MLAEVIFLCLITEFPEHPPSCFWDALDISGITSDLAASSVFFFSFSPAVFHLSKARGALVNFGFEAHELLSSKTDKSSTPLKIQMPHWCLRIVGLNISL